jgi:hypothetical protein
MDHPGNFRISIDIWVEIKYGMPFY